MQFFLRHSDVGALAQLGERLICIQEVRSSILLGSTIFDWIAKRLRAFRRPIGRRQGTPCHFDIVKRDTYQHCLIAPRKAMISVRFRLGGRFTLRCFLAAS